jgi:hypothetical protein
MVLFLANLCQPALASATALPEAAQQSLAERFKPVMYFDSNERCFPVNVEYYISNCNLNQSVDFNITLLTADPTPEMLDLYADPNAGYYLDNRLGSIHDSGIVDQYAKDKPTLEYTVYAHVFDSGSLIVVQYWFFYVFNFGKYNNHEGDWEMITVVLDGSEAPLSVGYSQHNSGQRAEWSMVEKDGDHPHVYVALGSHANYLRYYQGTLELARDTVSNSGFVLQPTDIKYHIVLLGEKGAGGHPAAQNWLDFGGAWGNYGNIADGTMGRRGPPGPGFRADGQMWQGDVWSSGLNTVDQNFLTAEWPIYYFVPIYAVIIAIPIIFHTVKILRKVSKNQLKKPYIRVFDFKGANLKTVGNIMALAGVAIGLISAFFPYYYANLNAAYGDFDTGGWVQLFAINGHDGAQINALDPGYGLIQVGSVPIPFAYVVIAGLIVFFFIMVGASRRRAGFKYLSRGINLLLPLILAVLVVALLSSLVPYFPTISSAQSSDQVKTITSIMSSHPLGGDMSINYPGFGFAQMQWGIGIGAYLMLIGGILLVLGAIFQFTSKAKDEPAPSNPPTQPQYQQPGQPEPQYQPPEQGNPPQYRQP